LKQHRTSYATSWRRKLFQEFFCSCLPLCKNSSLSSCCTIKFSLWWCYQGILTAAKAAFRTNNDFDNSCMLYICSWLIVDWQRRWWMQTAYVWTLHVDFSWVTDDQLNMNMSIKRCAS
jgi:hypothetical protein